MIDARSVDVYNVLQRIYDNHKIMLRSILAVVVATMAVAAQRDGCMAAHIEHDGRIRTNASISIRMRLGFDYFIRISLWRMSLAAPFMLLLLHAIEDEGQPNTHYSHTHTHTHIAHSSIGVQNEISVHNESRINK